MRAVGVWVALTCCLLPRHDFYGTDAVRLPLLLARNIAQPQVVFMLSFARSSGWLPASQYIPTSAAGCMLLFSPHP